MSDIKPDISGKLGPLPVWAWGAIAAGGGLIIYYVYKRRTPASSASPVASAGSMDPTAGYQTAGIQTPTQAQSVSSSGDIVTWITRAATALAGQSAASASDIIATLTTWYEGGSLTQAQQNQVDAAIHLEGTPPTLPLSVSPITQPAAPSADAVYRQRALADLNAVFGGSFDDRIATLVDKSSSKETAITTWANALKSGLSDAQAQARMASGGTYAAYHKQMTGS